MLRISTSFCPSNPAVVFSSYLTVAKMYRSSTSSEHLVGKLPCGKLCIVCVVMSVPSVDNYQNDSTHIYIVDLNGDGDGDFSYKPPTLRIGHDRCFGPHIFCLVGWDLYMFEICITYEVGTEKREGTEKGKRVFKYNLEEIKTPMLQMDSLSRIADMNAAKACPAVTPTPDGKIFAYSSLYPGLSLNAGSGAGDAFELYDPNELKWRKLPGICDDWRSVRFKINTCIFLDNEPVLVLQTEVGFFIKDLRSDAPFQKLHESPSRPPQGCAVLPSLHQGCPILSIGKLFLTPFRAVDSVENKSFCFPEPDYPRCDIIPSSVQCQISLTHYVKDEECKFCRLECGIDRQTSRPHLIIKLYSLDLSEYREKKEKKEDVVSRRVLLPGTTLLKSFSYSLPPQYEDILFRVINFDFIPA